MPDISMCPGAGKPKCETCYRFTAEPNPYRQSYLVDPPWDDDKNTCNHYWDDHEYRAYKKQREAQKAEAKSTRQAED